MKKNANTNIDGGTVACLIMLGAAVLLYSEGYARGARNTRKKFVPITLTEAKKILEEDDILEEHYDD